MKLVVAVGTFHGLHHNLLLLLRTNITERIATTAAELTVKLWLHLFAHVLTYSGFGISLHARVNGGVNSKAVFVHIVVVTLAVAMMFAPIFHIGAYIFTQIRRKTVVVTLRGIMRYVYLLLFVLFKFFLAQVIIPLHLRQDCITAVKSCLRV